MLSADWKNSVLGPSDSMARAVEVLEDNKNLGIALVVDKDRKLIGTITDGDIRRALIRHHGMGVAVSEFMNSRPVCAKADVSTETIRRMMSESNIVRIPVVDNDGRVIRIERDDLVAQIERQINSVLLMAGGYGTRLHPLTANKPKPLLEVGEKPILEEMLCQFIEQGFENFFISVHFKADMIQSHFGDGSKWGVKIEYLEEKIPLGTAGSIGMLPINEIHGPIVVVNGDLLTDVDYKKLLIFHYEQGGVATLSVRKYDLEVPYGVVESSDDSLFSIVEKPVHRFFVNAGIYILEKDVVAQIPNGQRLEMPDLLQAQVNKGLMVSMFPIHEYWLDIGRIPEYEKAKTYIKKSADITRD